MLERRVRVLDYLERGWTQARIARQEGVDAGTISRDVAAIDQELRESISDKAEERRLRNELQLRRIYREAEEQFERSKQPKEVETGEERSGSGKKGAGKSSKATIRREGQCGDPQYLNVMKDVIKQLREMRGDDMPKKVAPTDPTGEKEYGGESRGRPLAEILAAARAELQGDEPEADQGSDGGRGEEPAEMGAADGPADAGVSEPGR